MPTRHLYLSSDQVSGNQPDDGDPRVVESFQAILDDLPIGVVVFGSNKLIVHSNQFAQEILELSAEELLSRITGDQRWDVIDETGTRIPSEMHPSSLALQHRQPVRNVVMGVLPAKSANRVWLLVNAVPHFTPEGELLRVVVSFVDITARKLAEENYRLLAQNATDVISRVSFDGTVLFISPSIELVTGYKPVEIIGRSAAEYIHPDDLPGFATLPRSLDLNELNKTIFHTYRLRRRDGTYRWVESVKRFVEDSETPGLYEIQSSCRDVTERLQLEARERQAERFNQELIDHCPLGIEVCETNGNVFRCNVALKKMLAIEHGQCCSYNLLADGTPRKPLFFACCHRGDYPFGESPVYGQIHNDSHGNLGMHLFPTSKR